MRISTSNCFLYIFINVRSVHAVFPCQCWLQPTGTAHRKTVEKSKFCYKQVLKRNVHVYKTKHAFHFSYFSERESFKRDMVFLFRLFFKVWRYNSITLLPHTFWTVHSIQLNNGRCIFFQFTRFSQSSILTPIISPCHA